MTFDYICIIIIILYKILTTQVIKSELKLLYTFIVLRRNCCDPSTGNNYSLLSSSNSNNYIS